MSKYRLHNVHNKLSLISACASDRRTCSVANLSGIDNFFSGIILPYLFSIIYLIDPVENCLKVDCSTTVRLLLGDTFQTSVLTVPLATEPAVLISKMACSVFAVLRICPAFVSSSWPWAGAGVGVDCTGVCVVLELPHAEIGRA